MTAADADHMNLEHIRELLHQRRVFVTGATGFVGSHLTEALLKLGAEVHVLLRPTSSGVPHNIAHVSEQLHIHRGDLSDKHALMVALAPLKDRHDEPIVFHLGAQAHVGESWSRPYETFSSNAIGTLNLLQSVVDLDLRLFKLDTAGSSEEFGNVRADERDRYRFDNLGLILDETSPLNPQSVYATSKVASDFLTRNFQAAYGIPALVTRMFNNYGPRQNPRFITGTIITQALTRDTIALGYLDPKRDFCFVEDGAMGHICSALFGTPGEAYVYGFGLNISIGEWYELIIKIGRDLGYWGPKKLAAEAADRARLGQTEVQELRVDYSKLRSISGWAPTHSWQEGLAKTIHWFAAHRDVWVGRVDW